MNDSKQNQHPPAVQALLAARDANGDAARSTALAKIHARGALTARERIAALVDADSFVEYGLLANSVNPEVDAPADGIVTGLGAVDGHPVAVLSYDYSVYAGSQGDIGHGKQARLFELVEKLRCPLVMFLEGGGARAQDILHMRSGNNDDFVRLPRLVGRVPIVSLVLGRAFAGHGIQAGMSDLVIATHSACLGVAGPPLVESAFGTRLTPEELGPAGLHYGLGVIDVLVERDAEAIASARQYLELMLARRIAHRGEVAAVPALREVIPDNPRMAYDVRKIIALVADPDSVYEVKRGFAGNLVACLCRIGGHVTGIIANQPGVYAGTIDAPAANKMEDFIRLCDDKGIPLLFLVDSPGFLIGPDAEKQAVVKHGSRCVVALARARVPILQVVLRKSYGMSSLVMGNRMWGGVLSVAWPGAEFGVMGLEGAGKLSGGGDSIKAKEAVARLTARGTALGMARSFEFDDVIDPAETRRLLFLTLNLINAEPA